MTLLAPLVLEQNVTTRYIGQRGKELVSTPVGWQIAGFHQDEIESHRASLLLFFLLSHSNVFRFLIFTDISRLSALEKILE